MKEMNGGCMIWLKSLVGHLYILLEIVSDLKLSGLQANLVHGSEGIISRSIPDIMIAKHGRDSVRRMKVALNWKIK